MIGSKALYICYFGVREPLVQTQVIPYLLEIAKDGIEISLLTFEPALAQWTSEQIDAERRKLAGRGIKWLYLPYHKSPSVPATFYDVMNGARMIAKLLRSEEYDLLHCRIHIPMLMAALARKFSGHKPKLLFDIRGFFPEEYTDAGVWPKNGWLFRTVKRVEKWLLKEADGFVVLTEKARDILFPQNAGVDKDGRPVEVIPCCVDTQRFEAANEDVRKQVREKLAVTDRFVIAYVGSFGGWYLSEELFDLFAVARQVEPNTFITVLTQREPEKVSERLKMIGFSAADFLVQSAAPFEMPTYLSAADAGVSFIKPCYSKQASSPTKNAEYLASGLPIITNTGIGDVDTQISENRVGVLINEMNHESYADAIRRVRELGDIREHCREVARREFDLVEVGGKRYRRLYQKMLDKKR